MSAQPDRILKVSAWVKKAEDDYRSAEHLLRMKEPPFEVICFHSQQCAEKFIKAYLLWLDIDFPKTHDLVILMALFPENSAPALPINEVLPLNRYSIEPRYPGDWDDFTDKDAKEAMAIARRVREEFRQRLPKESLNV